MEEIHLEQRIPATWSLYLSSEVQTEDFKVLNDKFAEEIENHTIYPPISQIFRALDVCPLENVKVVILGQDPYHGPGQAHGLSFSVPTACKTPPSLRNIFKELERSLACKIPNHGDLSFWADQGVLLLNTALSVRAGEPGSHAKLGWGRFTEAVIRKVSDYQENVVFLLWGAHAHSKKSLIDQEKHLVLDSVHPSPLSAHKGFIGNDHFIKSNEFLIAKGITPIEWQIPNHQVDLFGE